MLTLREAWLLGIVLTAVAAAGSVETISPLASTDNRPIIDQPATGSDNQWQTHDTGNAANAEVGTNAVHNYSPAPPADTGTPPTTGNSGAMAYPGAAAETGSASNSTISGSVK